MSVSFELTVFEEGTAGQMPQFWSARRRYRCDACRYSATERWKNPNWREPQPTIELADIAGAIDVLAKSLSEVVAPDIKRIRRG